ncbi:hypothetical protein AHF37_04200 [Paragonimus kellicotti]|nr:hypothetical protein AHF37_04200 [Paragonimus kellicotti]
MYTLLQLFIQTDLQTNVRNTLEPDESNTQYGRLVLLPSHLVFLSASSQPDGSQLWNMAWEFKLDDLRLGASESTTQDSPWFEVWDISVTESIKSVIRIYCPNRLNLDAWIEDVCCTLMELIPTMLSKNGNHVDDSASSSYHTAEEPVEDETLSGKKETSVILYESYSTLDEVTTQFSEDQRSLMDEQLLVDGKEGVMSEEPPVGAVTKTLTVHAGEQIQFNAAFTISGPVAYEVQWLMNGLPIPSTIGADMILSDTDTRLLIADADPMVHSGMYTCKCRLFEGTETAVYFYVNVLPDRLEQIENREEEQQNKVTTEVEENQLLQSVECTRSLEYVDLKLLVPMMEQLDVPIGQVLELQVKINEKILDQLTHSVRKEDHPLSLNEVKVQWYNDGVLLQQTPNCKLFLQNGIINLQTITSSFLPDTQSEYTCTLQLPVGEQQFETYSATMTVKFHEPTTEELELGFHPVNYLTPSAATTSLPKAVSISDLVDIQLIQGQRFILVAPYDVRSANGNTAIWWTLNNQFIAGRNMEMDDSTEFKCLLNKVNQTIKLVKPAVQRTDVGLYTCWVSDVGYNRNAKKCIEYAVDVLESESEQDTENGSESSFIQHDFEMEEVDEDVFGDKNAEDLVDYGTLRAKHLDDVEEERIATVKSPEETEITEKTNADSETYKNDQIENKDAAEFQSDVTQDTRLIAENRDEEDQSHLEEDRLATETAVERKTTGHAGKLGDAKRSSLQEEESIAVETDGQRCRTEAKRLAAETGAECMAEDYERKRVEEERLAAEAEAKRKAEEAERKRVEEERLAAEAEAKRKAEEAERKRVEEERLAAEAEAKRKAEEAERKRVEEERLAAEAEAKRKAEEAERKRVEEERLAAEAEAKRKAEEAERKRVEEERLAAEAEAKRKAEEAERKRVEEERLAAEAEAKRKAEEAERKRVEEERLAAEAEAKRKAEEAERKRVEEERLAAEAEAKRKAEEAERKRVEEERLAAEAEAKRKAEEAERKRVEEERLAAEAEAKRKAEEAERKRVEEERLAAEAEAKRKAEEAERKRVEEERLAAEAEAKRKAEEAERKRVEEERLAAEAEAKRKAEEAERKRVEEERLAAEAEAKRKAEEAERKRVEEERLAAEAEAKRKAEEAERKRVEEERLAAEAEAKRKAEEAERKRVEEERLAAEAEAKRKAEEAERKRVEEERLAAEAEAKRKAEEAERKRVEEERLAAEAEAKRKAEEAERKRVEEERLAAEAEAKRKAEEAERKRVEEERLAAEAEAKRKAEEAERKRVEEERLAAEAEAKRKAEEAERKRVEEERLAAEAETKIVCKEKVEFEMQRQFRDEASAVKADEEIVEKNDLELKLTEADSNVPKIEQYERSSGDFIAEKCETEREEKNRAKERHREKRNLPEKGVKKVDKNERAKGEIERELKKEEDGEIIKVEKEESITHKPKSKRHEVEKEVSLVEESVTEQQKVEKVEKRLKKKELKQKKTTDERKRSVDDVKQSKVDEHTGVMDETEVIPQEVTAVEKFRGEELTGKQSETKHEEKMKKEKDLKKGEPKQKKDIKKRKRSEEDITRKIDDKRHVDEREWNKAEANESEPTADYREEMGISTLREKLPLEEVLETNQSRTEDEAKSHKEEERKIKKEERKRKRKGNELEPNDEKGNARGTDYKTDVRNEIGATELVNFSSNQNNRYSVQTFGSHQGDILMAQDITSSCFEALKGERDDSPLQLVLTHDTPTLKQARESVFKTDDLLSFSLAEAIALSGECTVYVDQGQSFDINITDLPNISLRTVWSHNDELLAEDLFSVRRTNKAGTQRESTPVATVHIDNMDTEHAGLYRLQIFDEVTTGHDVNLECAATRSSSYKLTPADGLKPLFTKRLHDHTMDVGDCLRLTVRVMAEPPAVIVWKHNGAIVTGDHRIKLFNDDANASLTIRQVRPGDRGRYSCIATNALGRVTTESVLQITGIEQFAALEDEDDDFEDQVHRSIDGTERNKLAYTGE